MIKREQWLTRTGFILASAGSAIGLGNIWGFPWRLAEFGGGTFLLIYLFIVVTACFIAASMEFAFGRSQRKGPIGAFENVYSKRFGTKGKSIGTILGSIPVIIMILVSFFYMLVVGWVIKYFFLAIQGAFYGLDAPAAFAAFAGTIYSVPWLVIALLINGAILYFGVQKGIERANKVFMPSLFIMLIALALWSITLPGAMEGVKFMLTPDWTAIINIDTWHMALGQAFFSVSLFGSILVAYGSYLKDDQNVHESGIQVATLDTLAAIIAALIIIPTAFAFGVDVGAGAGLLFVTLPGLFAIMPGGYLFGIIFFLLLLFACFSSSISIFEVPVEAAMDKFNFSRRKSVLLMSLLCLIGGLPLALDMGLFRAIVDTFVLYAPFGALLAAITFFWINDTNDSLNAMNTGSTWDLFKKKWYIYYGKYVLVIAVSLVFLGGMLL